MNRFLYLVGEGIRDLWRARIPALGSAMTIMVTLLIFGVAYVILGNFDRATRRLAAQYQMNVFYEPELSNQEGQQIHRQLRNITGVQSTEFISKERGAEEFEDMWLTDEDPENQVDMNEAYGIDLAEVLPAQSVVLIASNFRTERRMEQIKQEIEAIDGVEDVIYSGELVQLMERYLQLAAYIGIAVGIAALLIAVFLVANTIKLSIYAKRDTIETLYLLGASSGFIRLPFMIEGIIQGLIGAGIAVLVITGAMNIFNYILEQFVFYRIITPPSLSLGMSVLGVCLGWIGGRRSIRRFIDPKVGRAK